MEIQCKSCKSTIEYSSNAPKFCSECGLPFILDQSGSDLTATQGSPSPHVSDGSVRTPVQFNPPEKIADFRLMQELGRGGMGVVYQAEQEGTGRQVAVKLLQQQGHHSETSVERFVQEGRVAASLSHPKSTFVYAAGRDEEQFYIVMELMPGDTLKDVVEKDGKLPISKAVDYILDVIDGLDSAHQAGIVHRDVKPSNCFLDHHGGVKVGDYGLSKSLIDDSSLTRTGSFMGTPQFAAPEQVKSTGVDHRTDIYAVGATLFYLLSGQGPFQGDVSRVIADIASERAPRLESIVKDIPVEVDQIIAATLEKDPALRPQDLRDLRRVLLPYATGKSSFADIGRRLAAHFIDLTVAGFVVGIAGFIFVMYLIASSGPALNERLAETGIAFSLLSLLVYVAYYSIAEGRWGTGIGKWIMRLRVTGKRGGRPGIGRAFVRALFVPGILILTPIILSGASLGTLPIDSPNPVANMLWQQFSQVIAVGLTLVCFTTMRRRNGYRGLHEFASGTRVVRLDADSEWQEDSVPVTSAVAIAGDGLGGDGLGGDGLKEVGGFQIVGLLYESDAADHRVFLGRDTLLERTVWLVTQPPGTNEFSRTRTLIARPTRLHLLRSGSTDQFRWDAFEAVRGAPFVELIGDTSTWSWRHVRYPLANLAEELQIASNEESLPQSLLAEQVWIDRSGHMKLLDFPASQAVVGDGQPKRIQNNGDVTKIDEPSEHTGEHLEYSERSVEAVALFRDIIGRCAAKRKLPGFAADFLEEFDQKPDELETLDWAADQLRQQPDRPSRLTWDERLGIIAASAGIEQFVFTSLALVLSVIVIYATDLHGVVVWGLVATSILALATWLGYFTRGGAVFSLTGVSVRVGQHEASKIRCAWRTLVAWSASVIGYTAVGVVTGMQLAAHEKISDPIGLTFFLPLAGGFLLLLHFAGAIFSVIRPQQGLQDLLSGTFLVPK